MNADGVGSTSVELTPENARAGGLVPCDRSTEAKLGGSCCAMEAVFRCIRRRGDKGELNADDVQERFEARPALARQSEGGLISNLGCLARWL